MDLRMEKVMDKEQRIQGNISIHKVYYSVKEIKLGYIYM